MRPQQAASVVLEGFWDGSLPVDPVRIAEKMGYKVFTESNLKNTQSGFCDIKNKEILIREGVPEQHQRYSIAHEIGHIILRHGSRPKRRHTARAVCEHEADAFAAELLMPTAAVRTLVEIRGSMFDDLCKAFDVPQQAMAHRLSMLGYC